MATPSLLPPERPPPPERSPQGIKALILDGDRVVESTDFDEVIKALEAQRPIWVELDQRTSFGERLLEHLKIHPLAQEDVWNDLGLPKIEDFDDYLQLVMHGVREEDVAGNEIPIQLAELDMIIGKTWLVTHAHDEKVCAVSPVRLEVLRSPRLMKKGPAWVAHAVLDRLVDEYLPVVERFDAQIENVETRILEGSLRTDRATIARILRIKRSLQMMRRTTIYQREILLRLSRAEFEEIPREMVPFYRDVYDHFARVTELVDTYRDLVSSLLEAHFSMQSNRMNEIMKRLTLISTIMLPLTVIAGIYGMNFRGVFPELDWKYGYFYALGLMATVTLGILVWFKKKHWL